MELSKGSKLSSEVYDLITKTKDIVRFVLIVFGEADSGFIAVPWNQPELLRRFLDFGLVIVKVDKEDLESEEDPSQNWGLGTDINFDACRRNVARVFKRLNILLTGTQGLVKLPTGIYQDLKSAGRVILVSHPSIGWETGNNMPRYGKHEISEAFRAGF